MERVARLLREEIVTGAIQPHTRVVQDALAKKYDTSRIPVREALRVLTEEGLLTYETDVGSTVAPINVEAVLEVYSIRACLEPVVVAEGVRRMSDEALDDLKRRLEWCEQHRDQHAAYLEFDHDFHFAIFRAAEQPRFLQIIEQLWNKTRQFRTLYADKVENSLEFSDLEHRLIFDAVARRAADDAAQLTLIHMRRTRDRLEKDPRLLAPVHRQEGRKG